MYLLFSEGFSYGIDQLPGRTDIYFVESDMIHGSVPR